MARYGDVAVGATGLIVKQRMAPRSAWSQEAARLNPGSGAAARKCCPRTTYLTLCGEGYVRGVPAGQYAHGRENADHAIALARLLLEDSCLLDAPAAELWNRAGGLRKSQNGQVAVVVALVRAGLLRKPRT